MRQTSCIEIFHLPSWSWEHQDTFGQPPLGVSGYACASIKAVYIILEGGAVMMTIITTVSIEMDMLKAINGKSYFQPVIGLVQ